MKIGNDIYYVGVNDHQVDLFEGQYEVPNGMSYNSKSWMEQNRIIWLYSIWSRIMRQTLKTS